MNEDTIKKFAEGIAEIKATPMAKEKFGFRVTGARVLNLLHQIGIPVEVTTDPECDCVGGDTYYALPAELVSVAEAAGLHKTLWVKKDSKLVTAEAKKFHASENLEMSEATEQELYRAEEQKISKILNS